MARRFIFKLEPVLSLRRRIEELRKREFAVAQEKVLAKEATVAGLRDALLDARETLSSKVRGKVDPVEVIYQHRYIAGLGQKIAVESNFLARLQAVLEERRQALIEAARQVKVMERLRERRMERYLRELDLEERKTLDEVSAQQFRAAVREAEE